MGVPASDAWLGQRTAFLVGVGGAAGTLLALLELDPRTATELGAVLVAMIYGVYSGFALSAGSPRHLAVEGMFVVTGLALVFLSLDHGRVWLAIALLMHGVWDVLHHADHHILGTPGVPNWYVSFCATYDILAAALVVVVR
jgi:hypothetical protein